MISGCLMLSSTLQQLKSSRACWVWVTQSLVSHILLYIENLFSFCNGFSWFRFNITHKFGFVFTGSNVMKFHIQFIYIVFGPQETVSLQWPVYYMRVKNVMKLRILHRLNDGGYTMRNAYYNLNVRIIQCNNNNCTTVVGLGNILGSAIIIYTQPLTALKNNN